VAGLGAAVYPGVQRGAVGGPGGLLERCLVADAGLAGERMKLPLRLLLPCSQALMLVRASGLSEQGNLGV
jgi:hypothetical protein